MPKLLSGNGTVDMTTGNIRKVIITFAVPLMLGNLFQQFYSMVDTAVVGQGVGYRALAAVDATSPVILLLMGLAIGMSGGLSVVIARHFGSGDMSRTRKAAANGLYISAFIAAVATLAGIFLCRPLFKLINTPADIIDDAVLYAAICFAGTGATVCYNFQAGIMRALGDSKMPFFFLVIASLINIGLDLLFVLVFFWGVTGVAAATIISQMVSGILCSWHIRKHLPMLRLQPGEWIPDSVLIKEHIRVSMPMALFSSLLSVSFLLLQNTLNALGSADVAAYTAASKTDTLIYQMMGAFGTAISTFAAQNLGKREFGRIREGMRKCMQITVGLSLVMTLLILLFGKYFMVLFVGSAEHGIIDSGTLYMNVTSAFYFILGVNFVVRFTLVGLGETMTPLLIGAIEIAVRSVSAFFLIKHFGFTGLAFVSPLCWLTSTLLASVMCPFFLRRIERKNTKTKIQTAQTC